MKWFVNEFEMTSSLNNMKGLLKSEAGPSRLDTHTRKIHWLFELSFCKVILIFHFVLLGNDFHGRWSLLTGLGFESFGLISSRKWLTIGRSSAQHVVEIVHQLFDVVVQILRILGLDCRLNDFDSVFDNGLNRNLFNYRADIGIRSWSACKPLFEPMRWSLWLLTEGGQSCVASGDFTVNVNLFAWDLQRRILRFWFWLGRTVNATARGTTKVNWFFVQLLDMILFRPLILQFYRPLLALTVFLLEHCLSLLSGLSVVAHD